MKEKINKEKISVIATVLNEKKNIEFFVESLLNQSKKPDEIIIVDGGSTDKTYEFLKKFEKKNKILKVYQKIGLNISQGRNYAISKTKNDIIAGADAGTKYEKNWLENLSYYFKKFNADLGFGKTLPLIETEFQKILAKRIKQRFGSSRNIIFKKNVWKVVGGYPEDMKIGEDTLFNERIKEKGFKMVLIPEAIGYWEMRENLEQVKKQFYNYGYWDGVALKRHKVLRAKMKIFVLIMTILVPLYPIGYLLSKISKSFEIDFVRRFAYLKGFWIGYLNRKNKEYYG